MEPALTAQPDVLDQNCESRQALDRIADKWSVLVVYALVRGPMRHGELRRTVQGISQKMLTQTLRSMEQDGLVAREVVAQIPPHVVYSLTPLGRTLIEPLTAICRWAMEHLPEVQAARAGGSGAHRLVGDERDADRGDGGQRDE